MNVLEILSQELKGKDWTLEEKSFYIYIRSCQLFSYDPRYEFCFLLSNECEELRYEIKNRTIDLENVLDNRVICTTYSREVLMPLLNQLLGISTVRRGNKHSWVLFNDGIRNIEADGTISSDLARVKMNLDTYGYNPDISECNFYDRLKEISKKIGYIKDEYEKFYLKKRVNQIFREYLKNTSITQISSMTDDFIIYKLYTVKEIFEKYDKLLNYSDAEFCISYLEKNFLKSFYIKKDKISLAQPTDDGYWNFINIYKIKLKNDIIYFTLREENKEFCFYEITKQDAINYANSMRGHNKKLIYKT